MKPLKFIAFVTASLFAMGARASEPLRVPAFTAYAEPDPEALKISEKHGIGGWGDSKNKVVWHGRIDIPGRLGVSVALHMPDTKSAEFRMSVAEKQLTAKAAAGAGDKNEKSAMLDFGSVEIPAAGYFSFVLEGLTKEGKTFGDIDALILNGPAAEGAQFNLKPRRNAASVHLGFTAPKDVKTEWFYNEVTVRTDPLWSYYMACGFYRGYFGIQVNSPSERRIIFSVWDSGNEAVDRNKIADEDRVQLLAKGEDVVAGGFGNEGTGGHSHFVYNWKINETYRFLVSAKPDGTHTTYSGYFYFPEKQAWGLIATFRAPKDGSYLKGLYSFNEDFIGTNGDKHRLAEFGNQWIKGADGKWTELLAAKFSHDTTGGKDRFDYGAGVIDGRFYLSNGGFVADPVKYGAEFTRPAAGKQPEIRLP